jgi:hypothetical protein
LDTLFEVSQRIDFRFLCGSSHFAEIICPAL